MNLASNVTGRLDDLGKPAWIVVMILGFVLWWPIGLAILGFLIWSGRMGCNHGHCGSGMREKWAEFRRGCHGGNWRQNGGGGGGYSGNTAFEEYKSETLRRLEDEQKEFIDFLYRLRHAKDKAEFDQFMTERRNKPQTPPGEKGEGQPGEPA